MNTLQKTAGAILSLSLLCGMQVYAFPDYPSLRGQIIEQSDICQGVVKDANGESIIGASVLVKGTTNGSITGLDGDFSLRNVKKGDIIGQVIFAKYYKVDGDKAEGVRTGGFGSTNK